MTKRQVRKIENLDYRIAKCLERVKEDPDDGERWIKRLVLAEQIRALKSIRPILPTQIKGKDERATIVNHVTELYSARFRRNIQAQIDYVDGMLSSEGGISKPGVDRSKARFLKTK